METEVALRRLQRIGEHLRSVDTDDCRFQLQVSSTSGKFYIVQGYSVVLPEKLHTGKWNVHRSTLSPLTLIKGFPDYPEIQTLHDNFLHAVKKYQHYKYLGTRIHADGTIGEYKWITYEEASTARTAIGSGLVYHGVPKGSCIGLYFINRPEWLIIDHACSSYSFTSVPLYDTLGPDAVKYVINHAEISVVFCVRDTFNIMQKFLPELPSLRLLVIVGEEADLVPSSKIISGPEIISYAKLLSQGRNNPQPFYPPHPDDIATICYTSGTTGTPKGAMISHGNLIASVAGACFQLKLFASDIYISYLPLAHIYERVNCIGFTHNGVAIGFYQGDNLKLLDDIAVLRPTVFAGVPRVFNRIYSGILNAISTSGRLREMLFNTAFNAKRKAIACGKVPSPVWDKLVFNKIKARLGGRVRIIFSGASPISPEVMEFLRVCFGGRVAEGYGMTETSCLISITDAGDFLTGHVGSPNPACEVKLEDVPEMDYTNNDKPFPRGEVCVRGPSVFKGYFKSDLQTKEVFDDDGWFHTGDIGLWLPGGQLKIIDRKKNIFKLAQGEYIAPEKIENVYTRSKFVAQCLVYGDSLKSSLVAIVAVEPDILRAWADTEGLKYQDLGQLCANPRARAAVLADMDTVGRAAQLKGFEFAKAVTLVPEPFTLENALLTPTFKIKRAHAKEHFAKAISDMYSGLAKQ
eukprot:TRINITY_DN25636_c0_g1_i2.p1 TRINITY_DN25636_c0_g1~~TRINITY_DN25636_c0_g1_i2.p1  ORF type:complete len:690 (-),score=117.03 TRINITY_DN25636_c0_g1_i2:330-2399(-)